MIEETVYFIQQNINSGFSLYTHSAQSGYLVSPLSTLGKTNVKQSSTVHGRVPDLQYKGLVKIAS